MIKNEDIKDGELQGNLKKIVKSSAIVFIGVIIAKILSYIYRIVIARSFSPEVYGLLSLAVIISGLFAVIASLGLAEGSMRYLTLYVGKKDYEKARYVFKFTKNFIILSNLIWGILLFVFADYISLNIFHNENLILFLKLFSITLPFSSMIIIYISGLRAFEKVGWCSFINNIFQNSMKLILLILLILLGMNFESIAWSYLATLFLSFILTYFVARNYIANLFIKNRLNKKTRKNIFREVISYSWPIMFLGSINLIFSWVDSFVIGYFKSVIEVGFYNIAFGVFTLFWIMPDLFMQLFFPLIIKENIRKNNKFIEEMSKQVAKWILMLNIPLFVIAVIFPGTIINVLFGSKYLEATNALVILSIGGIFSSAILSLGQNLLSMKGKSKVILLNIIIMSIFNLILNIMLVPKYGIEGAAFSTCITWIILTIVILFEVKHYSSIIPLRKKMLNIIFASVISALFLLIIRKYIEVNLISLILVGILFLLFYLCSLYLMRCFDRYDLMILSSIKSYFYKMKPDFIKLSD